MDVKEVMELNMMRHHTEEEVLTEVETSLSHRKALRFERKDENGKTLVRARFARNFEEVSEVKLHSRCVACVRVSFW